MPVYDNEIFQQTKNLCYITKRVGELVLGFWDSSVSQWLAGSENALLLYGCPQIKILTFFLLNNHMNFVNIMSS